MFMKEVVIYLFFFQRHTEAELRQEVIQYGVVKIRLVKNNELAMLGFRREEDANNFRTQNGFRLLNIHFG